LDPIYAEGADLEGRKAGRQRMALIFGRMYTWILVVRIAFSPEKDMPNMACVGVVNRLCKNKQHDEINCYGNYRDETTA
jgi:hypothetical protein